MIAHPAPIRACLLIALAVFPPAICQAEEHITLTNGFELTCLRHEALPDTGKEKGKVRLYPSPSDAAPTANAYIDLPASSIRLIEPLDTSTPAPPDPPKADMHSLLTAAGSRHRIDADLLASLVHAESGGHPRAVSRAGARGLMQLMPATATALGVHNSFEPEQNIAGGTAYLDQLLTRFHEDISLALAAYNAGPAAVDRYHGIPPYRETRAYVARILNEYNRKKLTLAATH